MNNRTLLSLSLCAALLGGAATAAAADAAPAAPKPLRIVATIFPAYDWTRAVLGDAAENVALTLLLDDGVDLHSYQPTADDLRTIAAADLFIHVGGESDGWVAPALASVPNANRRVLHLLDALGSAAKAEETVEGMEREHHHDDADEDHDVDPDDGEEHHDDEDEDLDEHVWLSLRNAAKLSGAIAEEIAALDPARAAACRANAAAYAEALAALDADYAAAVAAAPRKTLVVADRFPLRYLADDYGLAYFAAFSGCSAEAEASFKTVLFLAKKADELGARALLTLEGNNRRIAETVRGATQTRDQAIVVFDSLQSTTAAQAAGKTYLGAMRSNLAALAAALR